MAFYFKLSGIEVRCDSAAELREALTAEAPAPGGAGGEEAGATQATRQEVANQATGTNGSNGHSNGNGQRSLEDLKIEELPLLDGPLEFGKVRKVIKQLHLPEDTDQRTMRTMLKQRRELVNA